VSPATFPRGLYAVTPDIADTDLLVDMVRASILGGARVIQYRNKSAAPTLRNQQAQALDVLCQQYQIPLIINDDVKLCLALDAEGVHIGKEDGDIVAIRARIGSDKILGVSCYNQFDRAQLAHQAGADYVAFGACFASSTKPLAVQADLTLFTRARQHGMRSVGIGGITLANAQQVIDAGADAIAVVQALFSSQQAQSIQAQAQQFCLLFS